MTTSVILHVGINETGATGIRHWLATNAATLQTRGVLYPGCGRRGDAHDLLADVVTPHPAAQEAERSEVNVSRLLALRDDLRAEIAGSGAARVVISSDGFAWLADLNPVQDLLRKMPVRVVIALRRHDHWWEDVYRQSIRDLAAQDAPPADNSEEPGFFPFMRTRRASPPDYGDFRVLVDRWAAAFGRENILVMPVAEPPLPDALLKQFLAGTGLTDAAAGLDLTTSPAPLPLSRLQLQLMDAFLRVRTGAGQRQRLLAHAARATSDEDPRLSHLPPKRRLELVRKNAEDYEYIAREYLGQEDGQLFADPLPSPRDDWEPPRDLTTIDFIQEALRAVATPAPEKTRQPGLLARLFSSD